MPAGCHHARAVAGLHLIFRRSHPTCAARDLLPRGPLAPAHAPPPRSQRCMTTAASAGGNAPRRRRIRKWRLVHVAAGWAVDAACACAGREVVSTDAAPAAVGPYSQAIKLGGTLYVSGQVPLVPGVQPLPHHVFVHMMRVTPRHPAVLSCLGPSSDFNSIPSPLS